MWYAQMRTDAAPDLSPELVKMAHSFKAAPGDQLSMALGSAAPILAVNPGTGSVLLYEVTATPDRATAPSLEVTGAAPAATPIFVRLGGPATGPELRPGSLTPSTILAYAYDPAALPNGAAIMSTYSGTGWTQTNQTVFKRQESNDNDPAGAFQGGPNSCAAHGGAVGSVSPAGLSGTVAMCWVTQEGSVLTVWPVREINNNTGVTFDAGYDGTTNLVLISGGDMGAVKSAAMDSVLTRPVFPQWPKIAEVKDIAFGPQADDVVVALGAGGAS
jgi:hypothetical protein